MKREKTFLLVVHAFLLIGAFFTLLPFFWMVSTSFKSAQNALVLPPQWIPIPFYWQTYVNAWKAAPFGRLFFNSVFMGISVTLGHLFIGSLAAFAFARIKVFGGRVFFLLYLATMMIPAQVLLIPQFLIVHRLGWIDTYLALIVPGLAGAFSTFLLRQFFLTLPSELEDAAVIDGASWYRIYWQLILPLSKPALASVTIIIFTQNWNSFLWPLVVTNRMIMRNVQVGLAIFRSEFVTYWPELMAACTFVTLPTLLVFLLFQKHFVRGIATTGLKE